MSSHQRSHSNSPSENWQISGYSERKMNPKRDTQNPRDVDGIERSRSRSIQKKHRAYGRESQMSKSPEESLEERRKPAFKEGHRSKRNQKEENWENAKERKRERDEFKKSRRNPKTNRRASGSPSMDRDETNIEGAVVKGERIDPERNSGERVEAIFRKESHKHSFQPRKERDDWKSDSRRDHKYRSTEFERTRNMRRERYGEYCENERNGRRPRSNERGYSASPEEKKRKRSRERHYGRYYRGEMEIERSESWRKKEKRDNRHSKKNKSRKSRSHSQSQDESFEKHKKTHRHRREAKHARRHSENSEDFLEKCKRRTRKHSSSIEKEPEHLYQSWSQSPSRPMVHDGLSEERPDFHSQDLSGPESLANQLNGSKFDESLKKKESKQKLDKSPHITNDSPSIYEIGAPAESMELEQANLPLAQRITKNIKQIHSKQNLEKTVMLKDLIVKKSDQNLLQEKLRLVRDQSRQQAAKGPSLSARIIKNEAEYLKSN